MQLVNQLSEYVRACFTGLWVQSHEPDDALTEIAVLCRQENWNLATWDIDQGLQIPGQQTEEEREAASNDPLAAIRSVNALATADGSALLVLQNFHRYAQDATHPAKFAAQVDSPELVPKDQSRNKIRISKI